MILLIIINALYFITITSNAKVTTIHNQWIDDYLCETPDEWSNCVIIYQNNPSDNTIVDTTPLYHGPYTYNENNTMNIILSRPFQCKYDSTLNISFFATFDCLFNSNDLLNVYINNEYEFDINIINDTQLISVTDSSFQTCDGIWEQQYIELDDILINEAQQFTLTFSIEVGEVSNEYGNMVLSDINIQCTYRPQNRKTLVFGLSWSSFAASVYFSLYVLLLVFIAVAVAIQNKYDGIKGFFKTIWKMRSIYAAVLIHLYDTATDIGVMIDWWFLAQDEKRGYNYESIDMANLFWASVGFLVLYRIITIIMVIMAEYNYDSDTFTLPEYIFYIILAFFDMYIIKTVWVAVRDDDEEPTGRQRLIQLMESICESLPQILLQSVFIVRGYNDPNLRNNSSVLLVSLSLAASVLSITNKYVWIDTPVYEEDYRDAELKFKCPCINVRWVSRVVYRFSMIFVRFVSLALIWIILGGVFLPMYMVFTWLYWLMFNAIAEGEFDYVKRRPKYWLLTTTIALVSNTATFAYEIVTGRFLENGILLSILTVFAFIDDINCGICADSSTRQASNNYFILLFIIVGWCAFGIETILACVLYTNEAHDYSTAETAFNELKSALEDNL